MSRERTGRAVLKENHSVAERNMDWLGGFKSREAGRGDNHNHSMKSWSNEHKRSMKGKVGLGL